MTTVTRVWDWPLRVFHWSLVVAVSGAYISGSFGGNLTDWHETFGKLTLGLLVFRLIWGFVGTEYSRFASFAPTPESVSRYLQGKWQGLGHNPLGSMAVLILLGLLTALVVTGLFANDDIGFEGPLYPLIDKSLSDKLTGWHSRLVNPLLLLLSLHLLALAFYRWVKGTDLFTPMLTGKKAVTANRAPTATGNISPPKLFVAIAVALFFTNAAWVFTG